jgi:hypothetical protein
MNKIKITALFTTTGTVPKSIENFSKFVAGKNTKTKNIEAEAKSTAYFNCLVPALQ